MFCLLPLAVGTMSEDPIFNTFNCFIAAISLLMLQLPLIHACLSTSPVGGMMSEDMAREAERRQWEEDEQRRLAEAQHMDERKRVFKEVSAGRALPAQAGANMC